MHRGVIQNSPGQGIQLVMPAFANNMHKDTCLLVYIMVNPLYILLWFFAGMSDPAS